ncbi:hypothetical protein ACWEJ6_43420 [Nonomuraea sp. NPDC004702]
MLRAIDGSAISARTSAVSQLKSLILTASESPRRRPRGLMRQASIDACPRPRPVAVSGDEEAPAAPECDVWLLESAT